LSVKSRVLSGNPRAYNAVAKTNVQPRLGFSYCLNYS
jgi:hypothetical protein